MCGLVVYHCGGLVPFLIVVYCSGGVCFLPAKAGILNDDPCELASQPQVELGLWGAGVSWSMAGRKSILVGGLNPSEKYERQLG